jgi:SAM-dependent methyltransferase
VVKDFAGREAGMTHVASREEVEAFLTATRFSGYQGMPLPHGLRVPGKDRSADARVILQGRVSDKTVLDIGTNYGAFPAEAVRLGAAGAVGIEPDPERCAIARRIAELNGSRYEIRNGMLEDLDPGEQFDVVTVINVLHHVLDPIAAMRRLAEITRESMIVEFCLPDDPEYLSLLRHPERPATRLEQKRAQLRSRALRIVARGLPMMAVANLEYHRTFYFSPEAFANLFVVHHKLFREVTFDRSPESRRHVVAVCRVS